MELFDSIVTQAKLGGAVTDKLTVHMLQQTPLSKLYAEGFGNWDGNLILLPLWALAHMAEGEKLVCIDGSQVTVGKDHIDDETRGGMIAFGFPHSDLPKKDA